MKLGIVGSEASKFTEVTERAARQVIKLMIERFGADLVISGHSPLGGIDWWAIEEADKLGVPTREYAPRRNYWSAPGGYRERNLKIAQESDTVACISLRELPPSYQGMRFPDGCYHCHTGPGDHVKSGGCWTMQAARAQGKTGMLIIVNPDGTYRGNINVLRRSIAPY